MKLKAKIILIGLPVAVMVSLAGILVLYYGGNRNTVINRTINDFSCRHPQLAINLKKMTKVLDIVYLFHQFIPSQVPTYSLTIKPLDLMSLNTNLPTDGSKLTAQYKKTVAGEFTDGNKIYPVKVRYRGDNPEHWSFAKKSWRINFDKELFDKQESLNLILPEDRYFFIEPWVSYMGKKLGLVTPELTLVNLIVNDKPQGVYLKTEQWGQQFLLNHNLSPDANLYGEAEFDPPPANLYSDVANFQKYTYNPAKPKNDTSDLAALLDLLNHASDEEFFKTIPTLIDMDNFFRWQAQSTLAFSHSQRITHNLIIYFNPGINKFQFIPWDVAMADEEPINPDYNYNPLMSRVLTNPDYMYQRNQILWDYVNNEKNLTDGLAYYDNLYQTSRGAFYRDSQKVFPSLDFDLAVKKHRRRIIKAHNKLLELLNDARSQIQIQLSPSFEPRALAYLEVTSSGFSSLKLSQVQLTLSQTANLSLIEDSNNNQQLDFADKNLGRFQPVANQFIINPANVLIHTLRDTQSDQVFLLKPTKQGFFIVSNQPTQASDINLELRNALTDNEI